MTLKPQLFLAFVDNTSRVSITHVTRNKANFLKIHEIKKPDGDTTYSIYDIGIGLPPLSIGTLQNRFEPLAAAS